MPEQENNPEVQNTEDNMVVTANEMESPDNSSEMPIYPISNSNDKSSLDLETKPEESSGIENKNTTNNSLNTEPEMETVQVPVDLSELELNVPEIIDAIDENDEPETIKPIKRTKKLISPAVSKLAKSNDISTKLTPEDINAKNIETPSLENLNSLEPQFSNLPHDDEEDEETKMMEEEEAINIDYSAYTKEQLLAMALEAPQILVAREAVKKLQNLRPFIEDLIKLERHEQLQKFIEAGNEEANFEYEGDEFKLKFYAAFNLAQQLRADEKKRIENEKLKNLATKNALIERIKILTESDETVDSITEIKQLQLEWKAIRVIPKQNLQELYDRYHFYLDKFYDNLAINRELKELDRQKNLVIKIELCNKADALRNEPSLKRAFILLAKYQEEFKNTGPVPREFSEEIWSRFKSTIDEIYKQRKAEFETIQEKRIENLKLKEVLVEKARLITNYLPTKGSEWKANFEELNKLMDEWKTIGQVPKAQNELIWHKFREHFTLFTKNRNEQLKSLNAERKNNISVKEDICKRAEEMQDSEDFLLTTKEFIKLQEEWKNSGNLPDVISHQIWKRFRTACDTFFNRKNEKFANQKGLESENLEKKKSLIAELELLQTNENGDEVLAKLKEVQAKWNETGFVPIKHKKSMSDKFNGLLDIIYKKFRQNRESHQKAHLNQHYNQIARQPGGDKKLGDDERRLREKIKGLKTEIETWENNIEFFARSKNAEKFRKDIEDKIAKVNGQIAAMTKELASLNAAKTE